VGRTRIQGIDIIAGNQREEEEEEEEDLSQPKTRTVGSRMP